MIVKPLANDCFVTDADRLPIAEAWRLLEEIARPVVASEGVTLGEAAGRILSDDLVAMATVPNVSNAAVDGYAFHATALSGDVTLKLASGRSAAGHPWRGDAIGPDSAMRVLTGAAMPEGTDTVVMQEDVTHTDGCIAFGHGLKPGMNCRRAGEDMTAGQVIMRKGHRLRPQDLAVCAAAGYADVPVFRKLRVALVTGGDELMPPGCTLAPGQVIDSNAPMLSALYGALPVELTHGPILSDDRTDVSARVAKEAAMHDFIITVAAASQGDEDHITGVVQELGQLNFWQIAMKPGRPLAFGMLNDCVFLGLPGNPIAAFVCSLLFVRPLLLALAGAPFVIPEGVPAYSAISRKKKTGRTEFLRGFVRTENHRLMAEPVLPDGSGLTTVLSRAEGLIMIDEKSDGLNVGDPVTFLPFSGFGIDGTAVQV